MPNRRRFVVHAGLVLAGVRPPARAADADAAVVAALRQGGVAVFRHALAPGVFDPEGMRLDDCRTQRNLDDTGRAQARRLGAWFARHGLVPAAVRSSPWCRCVDTATLAFGRAEVWDALGSPRGATDELAARRLDLLRGAIAALPSGRLEVWVTHQFVLSPLAGASLGSGEGVLLRAAADGDAPRVAARLPAP